jgi:hypothetical protein
MHELIPFIVHGVRKLLKIKCDRKNYRSRMDFVDLINNNTDWSLQEVGT